MGGEICDTADSITLDLDIWAQHLTDERLESSKLDNE